MIQPQVPGPVTAFANDGSYWPNMSRFCPNFPSLGEYREKHAYYMLYYTSNALSTKTQQNSWGQTCAKKNRTTIEPLFVTGNLWHLSCKPVRNLYSTGTLPIPTDTLKRCFVVFLFSRICCKSRQELPRTME